MKINNPRYKVSYEHIGHNGMWSKERWTSGGFNTYEEAANERDLMAVRADRRNLQIEMTGYVRLPLETREQAAGYAEAEWSPKDQPPPNGDLYVVIARTDGLLGDELAVWGPYTEEQVNDIHIDNVMKIHLRPDAGTR